MTASRPRGRRAGSSRSDDAGRRGRSYGIAPLHARGLQGQGIKLAIVGEGPTPADDVDQYRSCFGFSGTPLTIHGGSGDQPIIESSLDAMVVSMVAPQLDRFDLWVRDID